MTSANDEPDTPAESGTDASSAVESWLDAFDSALSSGDVDAATGLFTDDGLWRDLVAFTWNIKTVEGHEQIADMLRATLSRVQPKGWSLSEPATGEPGAEEAWIEFETAEARGFGHLRLQGGKAFTLLTTMVELKGLRGAARGPSREGRRARDHQGSPVLAGTQDRGRRGPRRRRTALRRHRRRRPGRHRTRCSAQAPRHPDRHPREERPGRRLVAQALQVPPPARPGLVRPPALPQVPRPLAGVRRQGQARRLARALRRADGAQLLDPVRVPQRPVGRGGRGVGRHGRPRRHRRGAPAEAARHRPRGQRVPEPADVCGSGRLPRRAAPLLGLPRRRRVRRQERRRHRVEQLGVRHLRGGVGGRRHTRRWCSGRAPTSSRASR